MNILDTILDAKRQEIKHIKDVKIQKIQPRSLKQALSSSGISVIAEIKMKSPSEGDIFPNADPVQIAKEYESAGASAISVLTDEQFFGGSLDILTAVRKAVSIPVIRKDFIIDEKQILETVHHQADAFLLIADALDQDALQQLMNDGNKAGLEFLVEYHDEEHAEYIFVLNPEIVGINCRNLKTMTTDISYFERMISSLPSNSIKVAESGISTSADLKYVSDLGYDAVLIGTSFMKTRNPGKALETLLEGRS
ncbi:MAG: indole-3-glycerol phosphate synthase TrpC [Candidatus Marinimicrobia bacterium]|jgi:indole-3-glycerol phosphate synthase|nr:indole-3-glycerol phosphate synthase TrpC [Candidatus Neomarinimicrobiota bacterium]MBT4144398.1 indole-3-glycerol phosphate synthase TrpC [Candidatus Neomarinimicrobiota bacterium]MBT4177003.1 indole-3-glycerol phosphate synthase TrpC [Candidatus Neomarinimicrobiota bacterium]MBT6000894.1 indole-3-glycerol phosphate synthase TrpC [Candidatus Neomarinimicrobiota bacterium]MBT6130539.1 indole-3-glycerol phosphate synthase TrpC [Candidatus Neomarinimicrobiota bacterium]